MTDRIRSLFRIKNYGLYVVAMLLLGASIGVTGPYLSLYCTKVIGMSTGAYGLFMAVLALSGVAVNTILAKFSDSGMNRKAVIVAAVCCSAMGYASFLIFHHYAALLISVSFLVGLGAPALPQIFASAREAVNENQEAVDSTFANSLLRSLFSAGFLIGPLIGSLLLLTVGYRGVFLGTSVLFLTIGLLVLFLLKNKKSVKSAVNVKPISEPRNESGMGLRSKVIMLPFITLILLNTCNTVYNSTIPLFVVNQLHGTESQAGLVVALCAGLEIPLMIGLGGVAAKIGSRAMMMIGCVLAAMYHVILLLTHELWPIIAGQLLQASFVAMVIAIALSYFQDLLPTLPGLATILYTNATTLGQVAGNLTGGTVTQLAGFRNVYWVCLILVLAAVLLLLRTKPAGSKTHSASIEG
ncbi:MFS transporter [Paenibacillus yonginensis]|uniref:MFS transporter n=1 Tax=Paenibacillus yonginensis TaxID=1462996 RepID=A0A1B1MYP5_9BACL|nr:sugar efflux transporter [Paenibacillus yonginensis]ANS74269.1 MFS transporter [Paenibacillus yonginensis]